MLSLIGFYFVVSLISLVVLASVAGKNATTSDIWIGAFAWPVTVVKYIQHLINY